ncbi:hypothetical protein AYO20_06264 [Fonsecaea nubica]|uniref:DUF3835 domain-containing protein n=1 Tax=Fonsecaea nubica TaxID=856822 RepID=A0A178CZN3_9EURO|nr:hypothetical protein AYO20_06264 [Fonsecaea nubica]OAL34421.1 hypothetical protein AYO20_06264 [Fonsecaea nubica]
MDASALARVELQRVELENNIAKLRKSLRHWQTLEIDYEGLKEEFLGIPEDASPDVCLQAAKDFKPEIIDETELQELLRDKSSRPRRPSQLVDLLSKRADYVTRNIETIRKQLSDAEKRRNALLLAEEPDHRDEAGLPLAEITEELDDMGQVISSKVETPGANAPNLIDVLKRAGVHDLEETNGTITKAESPANHPDGNAPASQIEVDEDGGEESSSPDNTPLAGIVQQAQSPTDAFPTNPNDTEAEAELRREMLEYSRGLDEVGAIVAELELEEEASDISYDENEDDLDFDSDMDLEDLEEDESEDESGKSRRPLSLPRGYQKKMEELQEKLGLKNIGPQPEVEATMEQVKHVERPPAAEAARKAAIARHDNSKKSNLKSSLSKSAEADKSIKEKKPSKKKVAFSTDLDIAHEQPPSGKMPPSNRPPLRDTQTSKLRPIKDSIIERVSDQDEEAPTIPAAPATKTVKQSRFKAARESLPQTPKFASPMPFSSERVEDTGASPQSRSSVVTAQVVERSFSKAPKAPSPDDFSEEDHQREIAREYQQHRMKRIASQDGGFLGNSEDGEITPLEDANGRKVSRFKAAGIKR